MSALGLVASWPVEHAAAAIVTADHVEITGHHADHQFRLASISKPLAAWATLVAVEEGIVGLDRPLEPDIDQVPEGVTLRHLLAHASGLPFEGPSPAASVGTRRIYSNTGIERAADVVARAAAMPFDVYLHEAVFEPLGMHSSRLDGSPAHGVWSTANDVTHFLHELLWPRLVAVATHDEAVRPQYPSLAGIVPGVGRFNPCPWGLGVELHGRKSPHWMGRTNSPEAFGHFGGTGTMMWADPAADGGRGAGLVALTDRPFDQWSVQAMRLWPELSDAVLAELAGRAPG